MRGFALQDLDRYTKRSYFLYTVSKDFLEQIHAHARALSPTLTAEGKPDRRKRGAYERTPAQQEATRKAQEARRRGPKAPPEEKTMQPPPEYQRAATVPPDALRTPEPTLAEAAAAPRGVTTVPRPWEPQAREEPAHYQQFIAWVRSGYPEGPTGRCAERLPPAQWAVTVELLDPRKVLALATGHHWGYRALEYDRELARQKHDATFDEAQKHARRWSAVNDQVLSIVEHNVAQQFAALGPGSEGLSLDKLALFMERVHKLQALHLGKPTEILGEPAKASVPLDKAPPELLEQLLAHLDAEEHDSETRH